MPLLLVHVGFQIKQIWEELPSNANVVSPNTLGNKLVVSVGSNTKTNPSPNLDPLVQMSDPIIPIKKQNFVESKRNLKDERVVLIP